MDNFKYLQIPKSVFDDLQKALDTVLLNKCRTRKVRVKYIGRT